MPQSRNTVARWAAKRRDDAQALEPQRQRSAWKAPSRQRCAWYMGQAPDQIGAEHTLFLDHPSASGSSTSKTAQQESALESYHEHTIEMVFAKLKHLLRKAGERTREGLWNRVGSLLDDFPPHRCKNYLRHPGYATVRSQTANSDTAGFQFSDKAAVKAATPSLAAG